MGVLYLYNRWIWMGFQIYLFRKGLEKGFNSEELLLRALNFYSKEKSLDFEFDKTHIIRTSKGKPFLDFSKIRFYNRMNEDDIKELHFNISHSDGHWAIIIGEKNCGLDIQVDRHCDFVNIIDRFFSGEEKNQVLEAVKLGGENLGRKEFFKLWTAREACGKYVGEGFFYKEKPNCIIRNLKIEPDLFMAYCLGEEDEVAISETNFM